MIPLQTPPAAQAAPTPAPAVRAQYGWGYLGEDGEGRGTLSLLLDPATGRIVLELHGLGERLAVLDGTAGSGYRLRIPRRKVDLHAASLRDLDLPFLPQLGSPEALLRLVAEGKGPGVTASKQDALGPVKLHYAGKDDQGRAVEVWLTRQRWERG